MPDIPQVSGLSSQVSSSMLARFRSDRKRLPLHPLEKAVLWVVALHLCFLPWALGTMHAWSQITSLALATIGMLLALLPRNYSGDYAPSIQLPTGHGQPSGFRSQVSGFRLNPLPRLLHFPIFWIGLALLGYIALQASNPSWVWERSETQWWLRRVDDIPWLPTSVDTPFERFNIWRQFIIYASAWLTVCTVWTGFTRRRALEIILTILALNGMALAITGFVRQFIKPNWSWVMWLEEPQRGASSFASFIYKNHAGAYLALIAAVAVALAAINYQRGLRRMARSTPELLWLLAFVCLGFGVLFTYSRGATLILAGFVLVVLIIHAIDRLSTSAPSTTHPLVWVVLAGLILGTVGFATSQLNYKRAIGSFTSLFEKQESEASVASRLEAYSAGSQMLEDYWQRGVGAGGFRFLFPEYAKRHPLIYKDGRLFWDNLHRDWYQIPIDLGAAGCALLLMGALWWWRTFFRHRSWADPIALILLFGCIQPLIQAWFDFPFANPAVLLTWGALGIVVLRWSELGALK